MLDTSPDVNIDQAILEHRIAAAQEFARAHAVDPQGRRYLAARDVRCRRAAAVPSCANDDEKPEIVTEFKGRRFTVDPADRLNVIVTKGDPDGREHPAL